MATDVRSPEQQLVHLLVTSGPDKGRMFFLKPGKEGVIGRSSSSDLRLTDPGASGKHCRVRHGGDMAFIEDLNSRNGTRVNGEPTTVRVLDENGRIEIGESLIQLSWVATESAVPLGTVPSGAAPTLLEDFGKTTTLRRASEPAGSTVLGAQQLQELRAAQGRLGESIGDFILLEVVGAGAMGFVYRAKNLKTRTEVALKLIPRTSARTARLLDRFLQECRADLQVPGAARLLATGSSEHDAYVAMEFAHGRNLQSLVDAGRKLTPAHVVALAVPMCETLQAAHALGVVHRDLKPANILLPEGAPPAVGADAAGTQGRPVLLDLGMGKKTDAEGKNILNKGDRLDSVAYYSPELTRVIGRVDGRTDMYSLAATLLFVLSGQKPFTAPTHIELVRKIRYENAAAFANVRPDVPPALTAALARAMEREAAGRYGDMLEFGRALKAAVGQ